jgi:putative ABC transport system permease protein
MNKYLWKNMFRELVKLKSRFISLFLILALSASFYIGFAEAEPLMKQSADNYFAVTDLADFRLVSNLGITDDDVEALRQRPDVAGVMPAYDVDVIGTKNSSTAEMYTYSVHSLPEDTSADNPNYLSQVMLTEGRIPTELGECAVSDLNGTKIGDIISFNADNNPVVMSRLRSTSDRSKVYTVVGIIKSPQYISVDLGNTNIGDGLVDDFIYLPNQTFDSEIYTAVYITLKATAGLSAFSEEYEQIIDDQKSTLTLLADQRGQIRYDSILGEANEALASGEAEYNDGKYLAEMGLLEARQLLDFNAQKLFSGQAEYAAKQQEFAAAEAQIIAGQAQLDEAKILLDEAKVTLDEAEVAIAEGKATLAQKKIELEQGKVDLAAGKVQLAEAKAEYAEQLAIYEEMVRNNNGKPSRFLQVMKENLDYAAAEIKAGEKKIAQAEKDIAQGEKDIAQAEKDIAQAEKDYAAGKKEYAAKQKEYAQGVKDLEQGRVELEEARILLDEAAAMISSGSVQLAAGEQEYAEKELEIAEQLASAEQQILDGKKTIAEIDLPEWFVFDRNNNSEYSGYGDAAEKMKALSVTMPIFMYMIAALICITTIKRMVEEDRLQIGTLKALGYRRSQIIIKYIVYAVSVGLLGGAVGVVLGLQVFPRAIWNTYSLLYTIGDVQLDYSLQPVLIGILGGTAVVAITAIITCVKELNSCAATLMRPKAPPAGKRVLLERIGFIWNRLAFDKKVTARNAFRYKGRFISAIVGVTGCMALLITGFGLNDSISSVVDLQFGKITHSEITVLLDKPSTSTADSAVNQKLDNYGEYIYVYDIAVEASQGNHDASNVTTYMYVPEFPESLASFISLQDRVSGQPISFPPQNDSVVPAVVITEKLANKLDVDVKSLEDKSVHSTISFGVINDKKVVGRIADIAEYYFNNYVFITPEDYQKLFGADPEYATVLLKTGAMSEAEQGDLLKDLIATDGVLSAYSTQQARDTINEILNSFGAVIWIIVIMAALLAVIVLYSLANINVIERTKELATLKVLGFYRKEIYAYILQENILLTVIGILLGIPAGFLMHGYMVGAVEGNDIMLGRAMAPQGLAIAAAFTLVAMIIVNLLMRPEIKKIDPAISLKSIQ